MQIMGSCGPRPDYQAGSIMENVMPLRRVRLELARTPQFPDGNPACGYEFRAPLDDEGRLAAEEWPDHKEECTVVRFWERADDEHGQLLHLRGNKWVFSYRPGEEDDEPIFRLDKHAFRPGEYVSVTEHDGVTRPFRVVSVDKTPHR
jgi:hypothetical protein